MRKVISVPVDKSVFISLEELGDQTSHAWIFVHSNLVRKMLCDANYYYDYKDFISCISSSNYPKNRLFLVPAEGPWLFCKKIIAHDIAFSTPVDDPEEFIFLKMADN